MFYHRRIFQHNPIVPAFVMVSLYALSQISEEWPRAVATEEAARLITIETLKVDGVVASLMPKTTATPLNVDPFRNGPMGKIASRPPIEACRSGRDHIRVLQKHLEPQTPSNGVHERNISVLTELGRCVSDIA